MARATKAAGEPTSASPRSTRKVDGTDKADAAVAARAPAEANSTAKSASPASKAGGRAKASRTKDPVAKAPPAPRVGVKLDKFLEGQLKALAAERATYLRQAESLRAEADLLASEREPGDVQFDEESGEGDTLAVERERDLALSAQAQAAVEQIDRAIERIADGSYGTCASCGSVIPKERLKALPYAALCVQCKSSMGFTRR